MGKFSIPVAKDESRGEDRVIPRLDPMVLFRKGISHLLVIITKKGGPGT